jgi:hypothetical protein
VLFATGPSVTEALDEGGCPAGESSSELTVTEIRTDDRHVFLELDHSAPDTTILLEQQAHPTLRLWRDGCPVNAPQVDDEAQLEARSQGAGTVSLAIADLPDGDLTLMVEALGALTGFHLRKKGEVLKYITSNERKLVFLHGDEYIVELPDCPKDANEEVLQ